MTVKFLKNKSSAKNGFTLVEMLLYVGISASLLLLISLFLSMVLSARQKNQTISEVEGQGRYLMQLITNTIHGAQSISSPTTGSSSSSLTLDVINASNDPTIFDVSAGVLRIKEGVASAVPLSNSHVVVSNLNFQNLSMLGTAGSVRVSFLVTYINPEGRGEYNYAETFYTTASLR